MPSLFAAAPATRLLMGRRADLSRAEACVGRALAALLVLSTGLAGTARADPKPKPRLDLQWNAPPECPSRDVVLAQIQQVLGDTPLSEASPRVEAEATVTRTEDSWRVVIVTLGESGGERTLESWSCSALTHAVALVLAIRLKPSLVGAGGIAAASTLPAEIAAPPPPPPLPPPFPTGALVSPTPPAPSAASPRHLGSAPRPVIATSWRDPGSLSMGVSALATLGELPSTDLSGELEITYVRKSFGVEIHGETGLVEELAATAGSTTGQATFRAAGGGARACYAPSFGALRVFGCGDGEVDGMWADGRGFAHSYNSKGAWATLGALAGARYRLAGRVALRAFVEALAPLDRAQFITQTASGKVSAQVYESSAAWGRAGIGVEFIFF